MMGSVSPLPRNGGARLLVVEDGPDLRKILALEFDLLGYRATICASVGEALDVFRNELADFDLVLTDFWMPRLNGVELALQMLAVRPVPILLMSAYCEGWTRERVKSVGLRDLLHKPITIADLDEAIQAHLPQGQE